MRNTCVRALRPRNSDKKNVVAPSLTLWERGGVRVVGEAHIGNRYRNGGEEMQTRRLARMGQAVVVAAVEAILLTKTDRLAVRAS